MTDDDKMLPKNSDSTGADDTCKSGVNRRDLLRGVGAGGLAAGVGGFTYLKGLDLSKLRAKAQEAGPVKLGFIEDESGNLAVYGLQKLHAAQLAVAEINAGKTLKGAPNIGAGVLGAMGQVASNPPVISKEGTGLDVVDDGGGKDSTDLVYDEDDDILIESGEQGILGREIDFISLDGQSNNATWQQHARRLNSAGPGGRAGRRFRQCGAGGHPAYRRSVPAALFLH